MEMSRCCSEVFNQLRLVDLNKNYRFRNQIHYRYELLNLMVKDGLRVGFFFFSCKSEPKYFPTEF